MTKIEFVNGKAHSVNVQLGVKLTTRQYESVSYSAGMTLDLNDNADVDAAVKECYTYIENVIGEKVKAVRSKYPVE